MSEAEKLRAKIATILKENISFSGQLDGYVIHGAIDKLEKAMINVAGTLVHRCFQWEDGEIKGFDVTMFESLFPLLMEPFINPREAKAKENSANGYSEGSEVPKEEDFSIYSLTEQFGSYVNILRDGKAWLGSVEHTIAREIVRKLNSQEKQSARISELEAEANFWRNRVVSKIEKS